MTPSYDVTVIVPAFNSAATLPQTVLSVMQQDIHNFELLIVNDGSTDTTEQVARLFTSDPRVTLISLKQNRGKPHAMNLCAEKARGRWIAVLDADDWYAPHRLSTLIAAGERADAQLVADNQFIYDEGADKIVRTAFATRDDYVRLDKSRFVAGCDPYAEFDFGMLKPMVRTDFIRSTNLRYRENARLSEDFLYLLEFFAAGGEGCLVSQPLYYWRQAFGTFSRNWTTSSGGAWRYDFLSGAHASAEVLDALPETAGPELVKMLRHRIRAFRRLHWLQQINRQRTVGASMAKVAALVTIHPSVWPLIAQRALRRSGRSNDHNSLSRIT